MHTLRTPDSPPLTKDEMDVILDTKTPVRTDFALAKSVVYDKSGQLGYKFSNLSRQRLGQKIIVDDGTWKSHFHTCYFLLSIKLKRYFGILFQFFFQHVAVTYRFLERHIYKILLFSFGMTDQSNISTDDDYCNSGIYTSIIRKRPVTVRRIFNINRIDRTPSKMTIFWRSLKDYISKLLNFIFVCTSHVTLIISSKGKAVTSTFLNNNMEKEGTECSRTIGKAPSNTGRKWSFCYFYLVPFFILLLAVLLFFFLGDDAKEHISSKINLSNEVIGDIVSRAIQSADTIKSKSVNFAGDVLHKGIDYSSDVYSKITEESSGIVEKSNTYVFNVYSGFLKLITFLKNSIDSALAFIFDLIYGILLFVADFFYAIYSALISFIIKVGSKSVDGTTTIPSKIIEEPSIYKVEEERENIVVSAFDEDAFTKKLLARIQVEIKNAIVNANVKEKEIKIIEKHIEKEPKISVESIMNEINIVLSKELSNIKNIWDQKLKNVQEKMEEQQRTSMSYFKNSMNGVSKEVKDKADNNYVDNTLRNSFNAFRLEIHDILKKKLEEFTNVNSNVKEIPNDLGKNRYMSEVYDLVLSLLDKYDNDKTGLADYALESSGGSVISTRCTKTYNERSRVESLWGIPLWYVSYSPRTVIQRKSQGTIPGECWCFEGGKGYLTISLSRPIHVTNVSYEHVSVELIPTKEIDSAPKEIRFWSFEDMKNQETKIDLGTFVYDPSKKPLQFFVISPSYRSVITPIIEMEIISNYGAPFTCLYRLRVHGDLPTKDDTLLDTNMK